MQIFFKDDISVDIQLTYEMRSISVCIQLTKEL